MVKRNVIQELRLLYRTVAFFLLVSFTLLNIFDPSLSYAAVLDAGSLSDRGFMHEVDPMSIAGALKLPEEVGIVRELFVPAENAQKKLIFYLEGAHANFDAESNTRKIIELFETEYHLPYVFLEGGEGRLDSLFFKSFPDSELKQKVVYDYLRRGDLSGGEVASILDELNGTEFYGIESETLYRENKAAFLAAIGKEEEILRQLDGINAGLQKSTAEIFTTEVKTFHEQGKAFRREEIGLIEYLKALQALFEENQKSNLRSLQSVPLGVEGTIQKGTFRTFQASYPELLKVLSAEAGEKRLRETEIDIAANRMIQDFKHEILPKLPKSRVMEINQLIQMYRIGHLSGGLLSERIKALVREHNFFFEEPKALKPATEQARTLSSIRGTKLFEELETLEADLRMSLPESDKERALLEDFHHLELLRSFAELELTRKDWESVKKCGMRNSECGMDVFRTPHSALRTMFKDHFAFYRLAENRDTVLLENSLRRMDDGNANLALIAAGGFHTDGITQALKEKKIPYMLIAPTITQVGDRENYLNAMRGGRSFMRYFSGSLWDALARDYTAKMAESLNEYELTPSLKKWRDRIIQNAIAEGRVTQAGQYTKYIDALVQALRKEYEGDTDFEALSKARLRKKLEGELNSFFSTYFDTLEALVKQRLEIFGDGLAQMWKSGDITPVSVSRLLNRMNLAGKNTISPPLILSSGPGSREYVRSSPELAESVRRNTAEELLAVFRRGQYPHLDSFLKQVRDVGQIQAMMSQLLGADDGEILHALQGVPPERLEEVIDEIESRAGRSRLQAAVSGSESYLPAQQQFSRPEVRSVQSEQWEDAMAHYLAQKSLDSFEYEFLARLGSEQIRPFSDFLARYLAVRSPQFQTGSVWPSGSIEPNAVKARYRKFLKENSRSDEVAYFDQHVELLMRNAQFAQRIEAASVPDGFDVSFRNALENEDFKGAVLSATREVFHDYYKALPDGGLGYAEEMRRLEELARAGLEADLYRQGFQLILHTYFDEMTVEKLLELAQPQRRIEQIALVVKLQNVFGLDERKMKVAVELGDAGKRLQVLTALKEVAPTKIGGRFVRLIDHLITLAEQENRAEVRAAVTAAELDTMRKVFNRTKTREIQSENGWYHFKKGGVDYEFRQTRDGGLEIGIRPPSQEFKTLVMDALGNVRYPSEFKGIDAQLKEFFEAFVGLMLVKDLDRAEVRSHLGRKDPIGLCVTSDTLLPIVRKVKGGRPKVEGRGREKVEEKQIVNVKAGDYVLSLNEETEKIEPRRINTLLDMGIKPVYRLTTASGRSIKTTANHPYLVKAEGGRRKAEGKSASRWIKVSELKVGDQIAVPKDQELSAINVTPVADFRDQDTVSFPVKDRAVDTDLETIRRNGAPLDALRKDKRIGLGEIVLDFHKNSLLDIWRKFQEHALGMAGEIIGDHFMPRFFLTSFPEIRPERRDASREAKNSGLDASMSSWISSITSLSKTSPSVLPFPSTRRTIPLNKKANFETWSGFKRTIFSSVRPLSNGAVIFSPPNRQKYITDRAGLRKVGLSGFFSVPEAYAAAPGRPSQTPSDILWDLIVAIEPAGVDRVWDIEVEGTHNFVGNGIFAHNTSAMKSILGIPRGVLSDVPSAPALEPSSRAEVRAQKDDVPSTKFSFGRLIQASFISFAGSIFFSLTGWIGVSASFFAFALFAELAGGPSLTRALGRRIGAMFNQRKELKVEAVQSIAATPDRGKLLDANPYLPPGIGRPEVRVPEEVKLRTLLDIVEGVHRIFAQFDLNLSRLRSDTDAFWLTSLIVRQKSHLEGYEAVGMIPPVDRLQDRELRDFVERLRSLPAYEDAGNVVIGEGTLKALNSLVLIDTYAILGRHGRAEVRKETVEVARILGGLDLQTLMDAAEPGWNTVNQIAERLETAHRAELSVSDLLDAKESELRAEFRSVRESVDLELLVNQVAELEEPAAPGRIQTVLEHALPFGFAVARPEIRALVVATAENLYRIYETQEHAFVQASEQISGTELIAVEEAGRMAVEGLVVAIRRGEVQELNNFIFYDRSFKDELHSYVLQVSRAFGAEARDRFHLHFIASNPQAIDEFLGEVNGLLQAEGLPALPTGAAQHIFGIRNLEDVRNAPNIARAIQMRLESGKPFAIYFIPAAVAEALPGHSLVTHSVRLDERDPLALKHSFALVPLLDSYFNGTLEPSQASLAQFLRQSNFASRGIAFSNGVIVSVSQFLSALIAEGEKARETRAIAA